MSAPTAPACARCASSAIVAALPFAARAVRIDPATLSSASITSVMDLVGVTICFSIAALALSDQLV